MLMIYFWLLYNEYEWATGLYYWFLNNYTPMLTVPAITAIYRGHIRSRATDLKPSFFYFMTMCWLVSSNPHKVLNETAVYCSCSIQNCRYIYVREMLQDVREMSLVGTLLNATTHAQTDGVIIEIGIWHFGIFYICTKINHAVLFLD